MHRFRKKSDAKRNHLPDFPSDHSSELSSDPLLELPPVSDFRTSLILPDLSRRFTLLRSSTGEALSIDALRSRFAEQRARGTDNHVTEEEEDMILESLGFRSRHDRPDGVAQGDSVSRQSIRSTNTTTSSLSIPSTPRSAKRYSNNLFGSGKLRDYTYIRSVAQNKPSPPSSRVQSSSSSSLQPQSSFSDRPTTPEYSPSLPPSSVQSSPNDKISIRSAPIIPPVPYGDYGISAAEYRLSRTLGPSGFRRASMALNDAIREIEEEEEDADDEILLPRSAPLSRDSFDQQQREQNIVSSRSSSVYEPVVAISLDKDVRTDPDGSGSRGASPIPSRTVPGYIPGMPRPMTPRENAEMDEQRSHSTTPRATSPPTEPSIAASLVASIFKRDPGAPPLRRAPSPSNTPPMFLQRSPNGRYTPEDAQKSADSSFAEFEFPLSSSITTRHRPVSPLSGPSFQPMTVPAQSDSRPSTPSNVTWAPNPTAGDQKYSLDHSRNDSWFSDGDGSEMSNMGHTKGVSRSLKSPALPDSPMLNSASNLSGASQYGTSISMPGIDLGFPIIPVNRSLRSPTPTQSPPTSSTFPVDVSPSNSSGRSSRQNIPSSPFTVDFSQRILFSPIANSSRSSLESEGSSYHSWEGDQKDALAVFADIGTLQPSWHDLSSSDQSSSSTPGGYAGDDFDAEDVIRRHAGLKKSDFKAIQEKLFGAAIAKSNNLADVPTRSPSLRRRRPSTSQSNYSLNGRDVRITDSSPTLQSPSSPTKTSTSPEPVVRSHLQSHSQSHSALLYAMVDSIQSPPPNLELSNPADPVESANGEESPTTRRNRDLAHVLFGLQDEEVGSEFSKPPAPSHSPIVSLDVTHAEGRTSPIASSNAPTSPSSRSEGTRTPYSISQNPSSPRLPQTPEEEAELAREVQRKTEAAMLALKRRPSHVQGATHLAPVIGSISRKRISPQQISTPTLVSASTSVDAIPLRSPHSASNTSQTPSKIGSRFKKLKGTLRRNNPVPTGEEITPYPLDLHSPPPSQILHYDAERFYEGSGSSGQVSASAVETERPKIYAPSPPASAGPGLKGFMARFRGKQRPDAHHDEQRNMLPSSFSTSSLLHGRPPLQAMSNPKLHPVSPVSPMPQSQQSASSGPPDPDESLALKQLFDAANNLGLDQNKLNDLLLVRSGSTSSKSTDWTMLARKNSGVVSPKADGALVDRDQAAIPQAPQYPFQPGGEGLKLPVAGNRKSLRKSAGASVRRARAGNPDTASAVVRRTLYFPSDTGAPVPPPDFGGLAKKASTRRRRASTASNRSVQDRVPTPPPSRTVTSRRFSTETSPPLPQMPPSFSAQAENLLSPPALQASGPIEKSNSAYDSLYEMYTDDNKPVGGPRDDTSVVPSRRNTALMPGSGQALEILELANGEVIWNIVNNLRDDDDESIYTGRASFSSEYSTQEPRDADEGVKVFFKEHGRGGSKGSNSSLSFRKKSDVRPETQVYVTPSAQIGRLIENLSQGMDSGTFNFSMSSMGHSASSSMSDPEWTVEDRLDHMLGAIGRSS